MTAHQYSLAANNIKNEIDVRLNESVSLNYKMVDGQPFTVTGLEFGNGIFGCKRGAISPKWVFDVGAPLYNDQGGPSSMIRYLMENRGEAFCTLSDSSTEIFAAFGPDIFESVFPMIMDKFNEFTVHEAVMPRARFLYQNLIYPKFKGTLLGQLAKELPVYFHGGDTRWRSPDLEEASRCSYEQIVDGLKCCVQTSYLNIRYVGGTPVDKVLSIINRTLGSLSTFAHAVPFYRTDVEIASISEYIHISEESGKDAVVMMWSGHDDNEMYLRKSKLLDILREILTKQVQIKTRNYRDVIEIFGASRSCGSPVFYSQIMCGAHVRPGNNALVRGVIAGVIEQLCVVVDVDDVRATTGFQQGAPDGNADEVAEALSKLSRLVFAFPKSIVEFVQA